MNINSIKELFSLDEEEREKHIEAYNYDVFLLNQKLKNITTFMSYTNDTINTYFRKYLPYETPIIQLLMKTPVAKHSAMFVPDFHEAVSFYMLDQNMTTAFMSAAPFRMVIFKELAEKMTDIGLLFIMAHEANHFFRLHHKRLMYRDPFKWNIATDLIINYKLLSHSIYIIYKMILNKYDKKMDKNVSILSHEQIFKSEYVEEMKEKFHYVGSPYHPQMKEWFSLVEKHPEYNEEFIYDLLDEMMNKNQQQNTAEEHIVNSYTLYQKSQSRSIESLYEEIFGDVKDEMLEQLKKTLKEYGAPRSKQEENIENINTKSIFNDLKREWEHNIRKYSPNGHAEYLDIVKRDKEIDLRGRFIVDLRTHITAKSKNGDYEKSEELTKFSRSTKVPAVHELLGFSNKIILHKKEKREPKFVVLTIADTSGSVGLQEISKEYLNQMKTLIFNHSFEMHVVSADTESFHENKIIINKENFDEYDKNGFPFNGGGGTDMLNPLAYELVNTNINYDVAIVLSDGCYSMFTKQELMTKMAEFHHDLTKDAVKNKDIIKRMNQKIKRGTLNNLEQVVYNNPPVLLLHTQELHRSDDNINALNTFTSSELQQYLISSDFCAKIHRNS